MRNSDCPWLQMEEAVNWKELAKIGAVFIVSLCAAEVYLLISRNAFPILVVACIAVWIYLLFQTWHHAASTMRKWISTVRITWSIGVSAIALSSSVLISITPPKLQGVVFSDTELIEWFSLWAPLYSYFLLCAYLVDDYGRYLLIKQDKTSNEIGILGLAAAFLLPIMIVTLVLIINDFSMLHKISTDLHTLSSGDFR